MPEDIEREINHYYEEAQNGYIDPSLKELFFPVDERSVFWEMAENTEESRTPEPWEMNKTDDSIQLEIWDLNKKKRSDKKPIDPEWTDRYYAIVDREESHLFTIVSESYLLIDNKEAYWISLAIANYLFKKPDTNENFDFFLFKKWLREDRASCEISICRVIDYNQPNLRDGWCSGITMHNSYNKSVALTYYIGFFNRTFNISVLLPGNAISFKLKKDRNISIIKQIAKQLAQYDVTNFIRKKEQEFLKLLDDLKNSPMDSNLFLAFFCKFFRISRNTIERTKREDEAREMKKFINERIKKYTDEYGQNAYAFLLAISDYISNYNNQRFYNSFLSYHVQAGEWAKDYLKEVKEPNFSLYKYIGEEAINTASWLNLL